MTALPMSERNFKFMLTVVRHSGGLESNCCRRTAAIAVVRSAALVPAGADVSSAIVVRGRVRLALEEQVLQIR